MDVTGAGSSVRIAVNDWSAAADQLHAVLVDDHLLVPLRAVRSLSRLDSVLRAADGTGTTPSSQHQLAYKCPSFPRLDRYSSLDEMMRCISIYTSNFKWG